MDQPRGGVRPSSGAAVSELPRLFDSSRAIQMSCVAAPGDGRTPAAMLATSRARLELHFVNSPAFSIGHSLGIGHWSSVILLNARPLANELVSVFGHPFVEC